MSDVLELDKIDRRSIAVGNYNNVINITLRFFKVDRGTQVLHLSIRRQRQRCLRDSEMCAV